MLIITEYIAKHELKSLKKYIALEDLLEGSKKILKGICIETKPSTKIAGCRFFKVRIGKRNAGRMIVLLITHNQKIVPLLIRLKKDKIWGLNMAMNNRDIVKRLNQNLTAVLKNIENKKFLEFPC